MKIENRTEKFNFFDQKMINMNEIMSKLRF